MKIILCRDPETGFSIQMREAPEVWEWEFPNARRCADLPAELVKRYTEIFDEYNAMQDELREKFHAARGAPNNAKPQDGVDD